MDGSFLEKLRGDLPFSQKNAVCYFNQCRTTPCILDMENDKAEN